MNASLNTMEGDTIKKILGIPTLPKHQRDQLLGRSEDSDPKTGVLVQGTATEYIEYQVQKLRWYQRRFIQELGKIVYYWAIS